MLPFNTHLMDQHTFYVTEVCVPSCMWQWSSKSLLIC